MTDLDGGREQTELEREALATVRLLVSGEATIADVEQAEHWRCRSPAHAEAFAFACRFWERLGPAGRAVLERRGEAVLSDRSWIGWSRLTRRAVFGGGVAAAAAYVVVRPPFDLWPSYAQLTADYRTATGEQRRIDLADGASAELNTQTSVSLRRVADETDRVEIIRGEAAIATGPRLTKPLIVIVGDGRITAEAARFNVRHDGRTFCVACLEGAVHVDLRGADLILEARHQVTWGEDGLGAPVPVDPVNVTAWRDGLLVFHQTPLADVVAEINRYRPGKIVVLNADLGRRPVNARFRVGNVEEILSLAQRIFGAKVSSLPGGLVFLT